MSREDSPWMELAELVEDDTDTRNSNDTSSKRVSELDECIAEAEEYARAGRDTSPQAPPPVPDFPYEYDEHVPSGDDADNDDGLEDDGFYGEDDAVTFEYPDDIGQPIHDLFAHVERLRRPVGFIQSVGIDGFDLEYEYLAEIQRQSAFVPEFSGALHEANIEKNRYTNILPPDHTRVRLRVRNGDPTTDFINANYLDGQIESAERRYISCQGPLESTFADFWRMVWEERASVIAMLTREIENGFIKCDRYWPDEDEEEWYRQWFDSPAPSGHYAYDDTPLPEELEAEARAAEDAAHDGEDEEAAVAREIEATLNEAMRALGPVLDDDHVDSARSSRKMKQIRRVYGDCLVTFESKEECDEYTVRRFRVRHLVENEERLIHHFQYTGWPDHGIPASSKGFLDLLRRCDEENALGGPLIVHCSAGVGRTGTFCAVHSTLEKYRDDLDNGDESPAFNLLLAVLNMRTQRPGMVQTKEQFMFCYVAVLEQLQQYQAQSGADVTNADLTVPNATPEIAARLAAAAGQGFASEDEEAALAALE